VKVRAVVLENFDKLTASGKHYASKYMFPVFPAIVGHSGIGELEDGTNRTMTIPPGPRYGCPIPGMPRPTTLSQPPGISAALDGTGSHSR
jgi:NADPH2:quinone reductase